MSYLCIRSGTFWFQIRVPNPLVPRYGKFVRQSLQTNNRSIAQPLALQLAGQWLARFSSEKIDLTHPSDPQGVSTPQSPQVPVPQPIDPQPTYQPAPGMPYPTPPDYGYQPQSAPPYGYGYPPQQVPPQQVPPQPVLLQSVPQQPISLQPQYEKPKQSSRKKAEGLNNMDDALAYWRRTRPDLCISSYREFGPVVKEFMKTIRKHPVDLQRSDIAAYRDKLITSGLARVTVSKRVGFISTLLQTAYDAGLLSQNVARGIRIPKPRIPEIPRRSFTAQELRRIFTSPVYAQKSRPRACGGEAAAWVPLIALATGGRLEEICHLRVDDIFIDDEHGAMLRICDDAEGQSLKNASSRRTLPIHPEPIHAGLLDYQEAVQERGHEWLFPELEPDHDGRRGGNFGKWFSRYLRSSSGCCILDKRVVFHSFRHTYKTLCREVGLPEEIHDALTGHAGQTVGRSYGHMPLSALVEAVARIRFPIEFPKIDA